MKLTDLSPHTIDPTQPIDAHWGQFSEKATTDMLKDFIDRHTLTPDQQHKFVAALSFDAHKTRSGSTVIAPINPAHLDQVRANFPQHADPTPEELQEIRATKRRKYG